MFRVLTDFQQFKLLEAVDFLAKDGTRYRLPFAAGSDLASTPPVTWGPPLFLVPCNWYGPAVYGHDAAYQNTLQIVDASGEVRLARLSKKQCDALCLEMMESLRPLLVRTLLEQAQINAIYEGVTIGGWHAFKEDRG